MSRWAAGALGRWGAGARVRGGAAVRRGPVFVRRIRPVSSRLLLMIMEWGAAPGGVMETGGP
jgi:hypothetical protein